MAAAVFACIAMRIAIDSHSWRCDGTDDVGDREEAAEAKTTTAGAVEDKKAAVTTTIAVVAGLQQYTSVATKDARSQREKWNRARKRPARLYP